MHDVLIVSNAERTYTLVCRTRGTVLAYAKFERLSKSGLVLSGDWFSFCEPVPMSSKMENLGRLIILLNQTGFSEDDVDKVLAFFNGVFQTWSEGNGL